jgi:putative oxidoreductase
MLVAALGNLSEDEGFNEAAHAVELGFVFLSLILIGVGKYSLGEKFQPQQDESN